MHISSDFEFVNTFAGSPQQDDWYKERLKPDEKNLRLSRNLQHALRCLLSWLEPNNQAGITIKFNSMWRVDFEHEGKHYALKGVHLPSLCCEAALKIMC